MKNLIWYNPDLNEYQQGSQRELDKMKGKSDNADSYSIMYELSNLSARLGHVIVKKLNTQEKYQLTH